MAVFVALTVADAASGDYEVKTDHPNATDFPGKNLFLKSTRGINTIYSGIMHEKFKDNSQFQTILDAIDSKRGDVLYLGMGLGLFAKDMSGIVNLQHCVELKSDIVTLCGAEFDTIFTADAFTYTPGQNYDTIVIDCHNNAGGNRSAYLADLATLQTKYDAYLNAEGQILTFTIPG